MTYTENTCFNGNNSTEQTTPTARNAVTLKEFLIEKNAKNMAYAFILEFDLLDDFIEFCNANADIQDVYNYCITVLLDKANL